VRGVPGGRINSGTCPQLMPLGDPRRTSAPIVRSAHESRDRGSAGAREPHKIVKCWHARNCNQHDRQWNRGQVARVFETNGT